jgi:membrane-associated protein
MEDTDGAPWTRSRLGLPVGVPLKTRGPGSWVFDWLTHMQASPLTYLAVLAACALDAVLPIVPSEAVVIAASVLAARGELSIWLVAVAAAAGGFLGDTGSYVLGRTAGASAARRLFGSPKAKRRLSWAGEALDRHGATIIVVARFVPGGRTATTFTAGVVRLAWPRFAAADTVGASLWAAYAAGLGYLGGETFERRPLYAFLLGLGLALLVALVVEAARRLRQRGARPGGRGALGGRSGR